jgi:hypothetical protein
MNDLDHDLREMFRRRESDVLAPPETPRSVARRTRRRQLGTVATAVGTALAVGIVAVIATSSLRGAPAPDVPAAKTTDRTLTSPDVTVTVPSDWFVTTYPQHGEALAATFVTNFDPDLQATDACAAMPDSGVLLRVVRPLSGPVPEETWPAELKPGGALSCPGEQSFAAWSTPEVGGQAYQAITAFGASASVADRDALLAAYRGLRFGASEGTVSTGDGVAVLLSSGVGDDGRAWTLSAGLDGQDTRLHLGVDPTGGGLVSSGGAQLPRGGQQGLTLTVEEMHGTTFLFGGVSADVTGIEVRPDGRSPIDAELLTLPESTRADARAFVLAIPGAARGTLTLRGADTLETPFAPGTGCWPANPCEPIVTDPSGSTIASGTDGGADWRIVEAEGGLNLVTGGEVLGRVPANGDPMTVSTYRFGDNRHGTTIVFGIARGASTVVMHYSGLPAPAETVDLGDGRLAFWAGFAGAVESPAPTVIALDASCNVIQAIDMDTGYPVVDPPLTDCST